MSEYSGATFIMEVKEAMYLLLFQPHICWELSSNNATPWQNVDRSLCCIPAIAAQLLLNSYCCCFNFFVIVVVGTSACISSLINLGSFPAAVVGTQICGASPLLLDRDMSEDEFQLWKVPGFLLTSSPKGHHWDSHASSCCRGGRNKVDTP